MPIQVKVPEDFDFEDLNIEHLPDDRVVCNWRAIDEICQLSGLDSQLFKNDSAKAASLIIELYRSHLAFGGKRDTVVEKILAEEIHSS